MTTARTAFEPLAYLGGWTALGAAEVSHDPAVLDRGGRWAVVVTFEGAATFVRFDTWRPGPPPPESVGRWRGPMPSDWTTDMTRAQYMGAVADIRRRISRGDVYQVNLCRTMRAPLADPEAVDPAALSQLLRVRHPAPLEGFLRLPGCHVVTASPELLLRREGRRVTAGPIKGTGVTVGDLTDKDRAENIMIVDLVRNDLARVCVPGSVHVPSLLRTERHPGLVHLVSDVSAILSPGSSWQQILAAVLPFGSVSGAPKLAALHVIDQLEAGPRGHYCGAIGWVDADQGTAELAVGIRTFWCEPGSVRFGTGAGITWGSDPEAEWEETQLKAARLIRAAAGTGTLDVGTEGRTS